MSNASRVNVQSRGGIGSDAAMRRASQSVRLRVWTLSASATFAAPTRCFAALLMIPLRHGLRTVTSYAVERSGSAPGGGGPAWTRISAGR